LQRRAFSQLRFFDRVHCCAHNFSSMLVTPRDELAQNGLFLFVQRRCREQIRTSREGPLNRFALAPSPDLRMVPRDEHLWNLQSVAAFRIRRPGPRMNDSCSTDRSSPTTPGTSLATASTITSAGSSPPLTTKSPIDTSSWTR